MEGLKKFVSSFKDGDPAETKKCKKGERSAATEEPRENNKTAALPFSIEGILSGTECGVDLGKDLNRKQDKTQSSTSHFASDMGEFELSDYILYGLDFGEKLRLNISSEKRKMVKTQTDHIPSQ